MTLPIHSLNCFHPRKIKAHIFLQENPETAGATEKSRENLIPLIQALKKLDTMGKDLMDSAAIIGKTKPDQFFHDGENMQKRIELFATQLQSAQEMLASTGKNREDIFKLRKSFAELSSKMRYLETVLSSRHDLFDLKQQISVEKLDNPYTENLESTRKQVEKLSSLLNSSQLRINEVITYRTIDDSQKIEAYIKPAISTNATVENRLLGQDNEKVQTDMDYASTDRKAEDLQNGETYFLRVNTTLTLRDKNGIPQGQLPRNTAIKILDNQPVSLPNISKYQYVWVEFDYSGQKVQGYMVNNPSRYSPSPVEVPEPLKRATVIKPQYVTAQNKES